MLSIAEAATLKKKRKKEKKVKKKKKERGNASSFRPPQLQRHTQQTLAAFLGTPAPGPRRYCLGG